MTREKLPRAKEDLFARHALRIVRALKTGELDPLGYLILKFLVDEIEAPGRGAEAIYTLEELGRLIGWPRSDEWLRQKLHALRDSRWIDFDEPRPGPNAAWIFRLKRAAIDGEGAESPTNLQLRTPSELEINSNSAETEKPSNMQPERVSEPIESPTGPSLEQSRAESETKTIRSEEKLDHAEGKTTATDPAVTDRLIAKVKAPDRNASRAVVEQAGDGPLVWSGEQRDGEQGLVEDCHALVDAGLAEWTDGAHS